MFSWLKSLKREKSSSTFAPIQVDALAPNTPFIAVGDIHGCYAQLQKLVEQIEGQRQSELPLIFLGDAIDRGPQSAQVFQLIFGRVQAAPEKTTLLMGNHEKMLLEFIDDPVGRGARWLTNGGLETLRSYGIYDLPRKLSAEDAIEAADALERALPSGMQDWLRALPLQWSSGNVHCVHAAMNPERGPEDQSERSLVWGHPKFLNKPRDDGAFVVHGHKIVSSACVTDTRVSIDTGAYRGRALTAAYIRNGSIQFFQARP